MDSGQTHTYVKTLLDRFEFVPLILMIHFNQKINTDVINTNLNLNQKYNSTKCSKENEII